MAIYSTSAPAEPVLAWGTRGTAGASFAGNVTFENVNYQIEKTQILSDISFSLAPGEVVCLLGPSGCGKTSLLRLAAGVSRLTSGRILFDGVEVSSPQKFVAPEKRNVGLMFQDFALFPHMSVINNVAYGLYAVPRAEALKIADRALERVGLAKYRNQFPHSLSGGEQQRVALARAIVPRPQVMLLDEPFSGLDQRLRETVRTETLALLRETRSTCIFVTHDPQEALEVADRILLMRNGKMLQAGTPQKLYSHPVDAAAARFFSDLNEIKGVVKSGTVQTPVGLFAAANFKGGQKVDVLIRPNAVRISSNGFEGLVTERRFLGETARLTIQVRGQDKPIYSDVSASESAERGQTHKFVIDPAGVLIFTSA